MKNVKILIILHVCFWGLVTMSYAFEIKKIGAENGLSNNNVVSIAQDRDGFIWVCTKDGLNRFDANTFKVFKMSENGQNAISSNVLNYVYADKADDIVWIATEKNGIDAYNYKTHVFTHYGHDYSGTGKNSLIADGVTHITSDEKGNLWLATYQAGLDYFDKKSGLFTHYNQSNIKGLGSDCNWCMMYRNNEAVYVGHVGHGFSIVNLKTKTAVNYMHDANNPYSLPDNTVTCFYEDSQGRIWIGTRNGLALFDVATRRITTFRNDPDNPRSISHGFIKSLVESDDHKLWIGTEGGGVNIMDLKAIVPNVNPAAVLFEHINTSDTPQGLSSASVQAILKDSFGNFWMGGYVGGLNFCSNREGFFHKISYLPLIGNTNSLNSKVVSSMCVDTDNQVWVANGSGGICIYNKGLKTKQINTINNAPSPLIITSVYADNEKNIWVGTIDGEIFKYGYHQQRFVQLTCFDGLKNIQIHHFFMDSRKTLWICTDVGLLCYHLPTGHCNIYTTNNSQLSDNIIRSVAEDADGNIWVGTFVGGLCVFDKDFKLVCNYGRYFDFYNVNHIYRDSKNRMWVASQNDLFLFKNHANDSVVRIGKNWGLAETVVRAVVEGKTPDDIWLSTTNGISYVDVNAKQVKNFNISDDILMGDYLNASVAKTWDGTIYFGSQNGIIYFNHIYTKDNVAIPQAVITGFLANNNQQNLNELVDIPFKDPMVLDDNQNSFQINFNVLDFSLSDKVEFMFQMEGLDDNWYLIHKDKQVTFRNLKPGDYIFNLKARLHNKEWHGAPTSMHITVRPPLWLAWWAKVLYVLLLVTIVYLIVIFYKHKVDIENALLFEKKSRQQEHELNEEKIRFFTNITHELRTPMTLILGPLEDLVADSTLTPEQSKKLNAIYRVGNRLLQLINQILEFRKSESKSRQLSVIKDDIAKHISDIGLKYTELNQHKAVDFKLLLPAEKTELFYDPEVVTIILDNLLANAFKFTPKGTVTLELRNFVDNNIAYTELAVADTGYGIDAKDLPFVFDRYYQAKNTPNSITGTGIGLALVKNMVELHDAEISVASQPNQGTTFRVRFLTDHAYPDALHILSTESQFEEIEMIEGAKKLVLVVDDNPEIVDYIRDSLMDSYNIVAAENGKTGFEVACEKVPDIVISDIMMPIMDGIELCKAMRQDIRTCHIPVVLLTAKGSMQDKGEGYDAGADSYLTKPFSGTLLKSRIKNILDTRQRLSDALTANIKDKQLVFSESTHRLDKEFLQKLNAVIETNIEDEEMNISLIATHLNMSHSTLYRKIKALTNLTANEYIRKVRMHVAEQLLLTNKYNISEIMYRVGINSNSYFRQCFKDEFGVPPSEYVQKLKDKQ